MHSKFATLGLIILIINWASICHYLFTKNKKAEEPLWIPSIPILPIIPILGPICLNIGILLGIGFTWGLILPWILDPANFLLIRLALIEPLSTKTKKAIIHKTKNTHQDGYRIGNINVTRPFGQFEIQDQNIVIHRITQKNKFEKKQVINITLFSGIISKGIKIHHTNPDVPEHVVFWTSEAETILTELKEAGYPVNRIPLREKKTRNPA